MTEPAVLYELRDNGVAVLYAQSPRPAQRLGMDIAVPFYELIDRADADEAVRVIVVTGAGRGFCAGADLSGAVPPVPSRWAMIWAIPTNALSAILGERQPYTLTAVRKPVIAAVNGPCIGFGFTLAPMCDVRFVAAGAKFGATFVRLGLVAEQGISWILPRVVGPLRRPTYCSAAASSTPRRHCGSVWSKKVVADGDLLTRAIEYADSWPRGVRRGRWRGADQRSAIRRIRSRGRRCNHGEIG